MNEKTSCMYLEKRVKVFPALLEAIVERVPGPKQEVDKPLRALIFDSVFNTYRGSVAYVRVMEGVIRKGEAFEFMANKEEYNAEDVGYLRMTYEPTKELKAGEVGYVIGSVKSLQDVRVGDTITTKKKPCYRANSGLPRSEANGVLWNLSYTIRRF